MALRTNKTVILAKIEGTYGVDAAPVGSDALLVSNPSLTPMEGNWEDLTYVRPYYGASEQIPGSLSAKLDFEIPLAGSGTAGVAPGWGKLLKGCAFSETVLAAPVTGTAQAGGASTITLAAGASAVDDAYRGLTLRTTGGTGGGQSRVIQSYVGATKVATVTEAWTTAPDATTTYSLDAQTIYMPISDGDSSLTLYFYLDQVLHKLLGARGAPKLKLENGKVPMLSLSYTGLWQPIIDAAAPAVTLSQAVKPVAVTNGNTSGFRLQGVTNSVLRSLDFDAGNNVVHRPLIGSESVIITNRNVAGNVSMQAETIVVKDWWTATKNAATGALSITHGTAAGNTLKVDAPKVQLTQPKYADQDGIMDLQAGLRLIPVAGNDEFVISVK